MPEALDSSRRPCGRSARRALAALPLVALLGACATRVDPAFQAEQTRRALPACKTLVATYGLTRPGYVSLGEWTHAKWDKDLAKFDADHDGRLSAPECARYIPAPSCFC